MPSSETNQPLKDPWARRHAWRHHPIFSTKEQIKVAFPGLGIATVAFTMYCIYDHYFGHANSSSTASKLHHSSHSHLLENKEHPSSASHVSESHHH